MRVLLQPPLSAEYLLCRFENRFPDPARPSQFHSQFWLVLAVLIRKDDDMFIECNKEIANFLALGIARVRRLISVDAGIAPEPEE